MRVFSLSHLLHITRRQQVTEFIVRSRIHAKILSSTTHSPHQIHTFTWHLQTMSASVASKSTTFPFPSSPHCAPSTTVTLFPASLRGRFCPVAAGWFAFFWSFPDQLSDMMVLPWACPPQEDPTVSKSSIAICVTAYPMMSEPDAQKYVAVLKQITPKAAEAPR